MPQQALAHVVCRAAAALCSLRRCRARPSPPQTGTRLPDQQQAETLGYTPDATERMTVPVSIGGRRALIASSSTPAPSAP